MIARSAIRQRIASALSSLTGYDEVRSLALPFRDPNERKHGAFSVEALAASPISRQRSGESVLSSEFRVSFTWKVKPKAQVASYDAALDAQELLVRTVLGMAQTGIAITLASLASPSVDAAGEFIRLDITFSVQHVADLA